MDVRKLVCVLLILLCTALSAGCGKREDEGDNIYEVYYVSNSATKVEMHTYQMEAETFEGQLEELLACLSTNPKKLEYQAPLSMGFEVLDKKVEDGRLLLDVSAAYTGLPMTTQVLVRAAIVRTLTQLNDVNMVMMTVEGTPL